MKQPFYINKNGVLRRQHNTLRFDYEDGHTYLPIEQMDALYLFGAMDLNVNLLDLFAFHKIPIHFFNFNSRYIGSFTPSEAQLSGSTLLKQATFVNDLSKRLVIAKEIVKGSQSNILKNIRKFIRNYEIEAIAVLTEAILRDMKNTEKSNDVSQLMGYEGNVRKRYYQIIDHVMVNKNPEFVMDGRVKRPPNNKMNSLVSFVNSLVYTTTINQIFRTSLNQTLSFLHQPAERRFSLSLDISEVFKPLLSDRLIFRMVNLKMLNQSCFDEVSGVCYLNEKGRKKVIEEYNQKLQTTIKHRTLEQNVSYERLIRLECHKLVKHLLGEKTYSSFKMWW